MDLPIMTLSKLNKVYSKLVSIDTASLMTVNQGLRWCHSYIHNTCLNGCKYCYANFNDEKVKENVRLYNQASPLLCGNITSDDKITDRKVKSLKDAQLSFFE